MRNWSKIKKKFLRQIIFIFLILLTLTIFFLIPLLNQEKDKLIVSLRNLVLPFGLFFLFILFFLMTFLKKKEKIIFVIFWAGTIFLTVFDLFRFGWKYNPFVKKELLFPKTPVIEYLQKQEKPFRVLSEKGIIPSNMWTSYKLEFPVGYDPIYLQRTATFLTLANGGKFENPAGRYGEIKKFDSPLIDLVNVRYLLALKDEQSMNNISEERKPAKILPQKFKLAFEDKSIQVFENTAVLPRAFMVYNYETQKDGAEIFKSLLKNDFDLSKKIVLEEALAFDLKEGHASEVNYFGQVNGESEILIDHSGDGLLFVSDSYYPGWKAFVDDRETRIYRANYNFRAVFVPAGKHKVVFKYRPESFKIGLYLSGGALLLIFSGGMIFLKKRKLS